jgi:predicted phage-related endonuclease
MTTTELTATAREYREIQAEIKALQEQAETLKQNMMDEMDCRNVEKLEVGEYTIRWGLYESSRLDTAKLKAEHGDLYAAYSKTMCSTRFSVA